MTYNIQDGALGRERLHLQIFRSVQPDLILLQEVIDPAVVQRWAAELEMKFVVARGYTRRPVALLSRNPILSSHSYSPVPKLSRDFLAASIEYKPGNVLDVFCIHLAAQPFVLFEWLRAIEIASVLRQATQQPSIPCLIAGDFNAVSPRDKPITFSLPLRLKIMLFAQGNRFLHTAISKVTAAQFTDCFRLLHTDPGFTLPTSEPTIRFDYIFSNAMLSARLQSCSVVRQPMAVEHPSDHYPVMADFAL